MLNNNSLLIACVGEMEKPCVLILVDDTEHEEDEELRLVLGSPKSESPFGASIGAQNETLIKIKDDADSETFISHFLTFLCPLAIAVIRQSPRKYCIELQGSGFFIQKKIQILKVYRR